MKHQRNNSKNLFRLKIPKVTQARNSAGANPVQAKTRASKSPESQEGEVLEMHNYYYYDCYYYYYYSCCYFFFSWQQ